MNRSSGVTESLTEQELARIWSEVLGVTQIERDDTLADLGGGSLAVESVIVQARTRLPMQISAADFVDDPSLAQLAARLDDAHRQRFGRRRSACVELRSGDRGPAVFCFAGAGSTSAYFIPLANALPGDQPVFALQAHGIESRGFPAWTVRSAVRRHVRHIRKVQPKGPYLLLGHSFGGVLALEAARRLTDSGAQVRSLVLLDTVVDSEASLRAWNDSASDAESSDHQGPDEARHTESTEVPGLGRRLLTNARLLGAGWVRYGLGTQKHVFWELAVRAQRRHHIRPWRGPATILLTAHTREQREYWPKFLGEDVAVHDVPGDHLSMIGQAEVLEILRAALARGAAD